MFCVMLDVPVPSVSKRKGFLFLPNEKPGKSSQMNDF